MNKKLERIKRIAIRNCNRCNSEGCDSCLRKQARMMQYDKASIPMEFWNRSFKDFNGNKNFKNFFTKKLKDIDAFYDRGKSMFIYGTFGTGKTYSACCMLKIALTKGYTGHYTSMSDVINKLLSREYDSGSYIKELAEYDFLIIDEFDKRWVFPSEKSQIIFGSSMENILRCRFQNMLPTIMCSNTLSFDDIFTEEYSKAITSLSSKYVDQIPLGGLDMRRKNV
jgi:DNA replication protein DnaC